MINISLKEIVKSILPKKIIKIFKTNYLDESSYDIKVINYQVNNCCNSKCVMCNVWKQNDMEYLSIDQFKRILAYPLFQKVEHIGITGGEPTLVDDLPEYFRVAINTLPNLQGLSTITNSLLPQKVISSIKEINELCVANQKDFSVMISLDGVDVIHDNNRGVKGSFNKVQRVVEFLKDMNISFSTGTTITKINVWNLDELLLFLREKDIYGRFRIAEFINRLDNSSNTENIRNFSDDERYQLLLFFSKLEHTYEHNEGVNNTYRNIRNMLSGGVRLIGCPYKDKVAVNLDCHGGLAYCAPKSNIIGNLLQKSASCLYNNNLEHLEYIKKNHCNACIHDYHSSPSLEMVEKIDEEKYWRQFFTVKKFMEHKDSLVITKRFEKSDVYKVLIVGWYGTETVGDKAILGGILEQYKAKLPQATFIISSLYPFVTERTIQELKIDAQIVPVFSSDFFAWASVVNEVVIGGGPLMELEELSLLLWAFYLGKKNNARTIVFGCGIGPLYTEEKINAVTEILGLSDEIYLRDEESINTGNRLIGRSDIKNIGDPAVGFLKRNYLNIKVKEKAGLACFLRELTAEYRGNKSIEEFCEYKQKFEEALALNIINFCDQNGLIPNFYSMHNFVIGNDDRDFNLEFTRKYFSNREFYVENKLSTVDSIVQAMRSSKINLCMRFHSVVFANTLNTDFVAIDYTSGGKIHGYLSDERKAESMVTLDSIVNNSNAINKNFINR